MASFTPVGDACRCKIAVDAAAKLSKVNPNIYGGFVEHMGRCVYGGIYDPDSSLSDEKGCRKDVMQALRELDPPVIRYPGGNFCATYHWEDGIGPRDLRPRRPELAWLGEEPNTFGTDEFLDWCAQLGAEPYLCLNMGTGTLDEALHWLEYCNSSRNTHYANLRRKNGHEKPYGVKYWSLGNELWGPWQVEQATKEDYAKKAAQWAKALKLLDPSIQLILCGETGYSSWDYHVLQKNIHCIDMHSIHIYTASANHMSNVSAPYSAERAIEMTTSLIDLARIEKNVNKKPTICFDEWNVWDPVRAPGDKGAEELYTLSDALAVAVWLGVFVRQAKHMGMANIAQSVNVISPLMTTKNGITKQTTYWALWLFSRFMRGEMVKTHTWTPLYEGPTEPKWLASTRDIPMLDVSAVISEKGEVSLAVTNISDDRDCETEVLGLESDVIEVFTVSGPDANAVNKEGDEKVGVKQSAWDGKGKYNFSKLSLTLMRTTIA